MSRRRPVSTQELLRIATETALQDVHTCVPGVIQTYAKQRADVLPLVRRPLRDEDNNLLYESLPVLPGVPVVWPRGNGFGMHIGLTKGDIVTLVFSEQSFAEWRSTGAVGSPKNVRRHGLFPIALPGLGDDNHPFGSLADGRMRLGKDDSNNQVRFDDDHINVYAGGPAAARKGDTVHCGFLVVDPTGLVKQYFGGDADGSTVNSTAADNYITNVLSGMGTKIALTPGVIISGSGKVNVG